MDSAYSLSSHKFSRTRSNGNGQCSTNLKTGPRLHVGGGGRVNRRSYNFLRYGRLARYFCRFDNCNVETGDRVHGSVGVPYFRLRGGFYPQEPHAKFR